MKKNLLTPTETDIVLFNEENVRRTWYNDEWYFSVIDIVWILTESDNSKKYWSVLKTRLKAEWSEVATICSQLKMKAKDWKMRETDCANTESVLRLIQSIPSKNAEPLKQWLAGLGNERIQEANDPELWMIRARERAIIRYKSKGMTDDEIKRRLSTIETRNNLTDEYKSRGIKGTEYWILTNYWYSIFGTTAQGIKSLKWLWKNDNPRDHMNKTEMLLTELTEETSKTIIQSKNAKGFNEIAPCVQESVDIVGEAKNKIEEATKKPVLTEFNRLSDKQKALRKKEQKAIKKINNKKQ